jgi:hypothetical protein
MTRRVRAAALVFAMTAAGGILGAAAVAYACIRDGTIELDRSEAFAGETVRVTGRDFVSGAEVEIHLDSLERAAVWSGTADALGRFEAPFDVPKIDPGTHYVVAHYHPHTSGEPARAVLNVVARPAREEATTSTKAEPRPRPGTEVAASAGDRARRVEKADRKRTRPAERRAGKARTERARSAPEREVAESQPEVNAAAAPDDARLKTAGSNTAGWLELLLTSVVVVAAFAGIGAFVSRRKRLVSH